MEVLSGLRMVGNCRDRAFSRLHYLGLVAGEGFWFETPLNQRPVKFFGMLFIFHFAHSIILFSRTNLSTLKFYVNF
jgi:hypothetical protein